MSATVCLFLQDLLAESAKAGLFMIQKNSKATEHMDFINVQDLCFKRGARTIFDGLHLVAAKGRITAIIGPSGIGKTTLLKLITGQLDPTAGTVIIDGQTVHKLSRKKLFHLRRRIGMLFQSGALFTDMTVYENIAYPLSIHTDLPQQMIHDLVLMKLEAVGLRGSQRMMPNELSGGMARRVALARAIALDPELILYDEPFVGQDPIAMGVTVSLIKKLTDYLGLTSVIVSHDIEETLNIADYVYMIMDGKAIAEGTPQQIRDHGSALVQQFIQGLPDGPVQFHYPAPAIEQDMRL